MSFEGVLGQDVPVDVLRRALAGGKVASSYLFEGPSGVGKERAAVALAKAAIGGGPEIDRRIDQGGHPDVRIFRPRDEGKRNIPVEHLRAEILPFAQFAPFEAPAAFLIFPEADVSFPEHPAEAANALLKTLEEPRNRVHFILISERPDRFLPTIRSRCQRLRFGRLPTNVIESILREAEVDEARIAPALALADGRADRALELATGGLDERLDRALAIDEACAGGGPGTLSRAAEELNRSKDVRPVLELLATFYRDVAAAALGMPEPTLAFRHRADRIRERAEELGAERAAARVERLAEASLALDRNANHQLVLDALLTDLRT